jgi:hypothetical protein
MMTQWGFKFLLLAILFFPSVSCERQAPNRPPTVSAQAVWAGGSDGGVWIKCDSLTSNERFSCVTFNDAGYVWARGEYLIRTANWDSQRKAPSYSRLQQSPGQLVFSGFDGRVIYLQNSMVLLPDGVIDYPFPMLDTHGKKQSYKEGTALNTEIEY